MKIIDPYIIIEDDLNGEEILKKIEKCGRTAYKSEDKITKDSARKFAAMIISRKHESVLEHHLITVRVICDRGITHEIVRHRVASYTQESTRYCNYAKGKFDNELTFIKPNFWNIENRTDKTKFEIWKESLADAEKNYMKLIESGATPQEARSVLPNSLKSEIVVTMNLRSWRNFFVLRTDKSAHPQMIQIAQMIKSEFQKNIPIIFDDL